MNKKNGYIIGFKNILGIVRDCNEVARIYIGANYETLCLEIPKHFKPISDMRN
ncbi:MAG: hypothetical protein JXR68_13395 [Bacteroidales bacterium]|nr:hypothetical protein [Bacteroidales bacterium]